MRRSFVQWIASWWRGTPMDASGPLPLMAEDELRESYLRHLGEREYSPDERLAHHFYHLMLYWRRLIGFMGAVTEAGGAGESGAGWLRGTLWTTVKIGSEMTDAGVREFVARTGEAELGAAWAEYAAALASIDVRAADAVARTRAAHARFARVDEIRRELALLHHYEVRPLVLAPGSPAQP